MTRLGRARQAMSRFSGSVDVGYLRKWLVISILIGIAAGLSSILFYSAIGWSTGGMLGGIAG